MECLAVLLPHKKEDESWLGVIDMDECCFAVNCERDCKRQGKTNPCHTYPAASYDFFQALVRNSPPRACHSGRSVKMAEHGLVIDFCSSNPLEDNTLVATATSLASSF